MIFEGEMIFFRKFYEHSNGNVLGDQKICNIEYSSHSLLTEVASRLRIIIGKWKSRTSLSGNKTPFVPRIILINFKRSCSRLCDEIELLILNHTEMLILTYTHTSYMMV